MDNLKARFDQARAPWSDIQGHLDTFVDLVVDNGYRKILELGVRHGTSTAAWLWAAEQTDGHVWSVDIEELVKFDTDRWTFLLGDDWDPTVAETLAIVAPFDVIFVDTSHEHTHTIHEIGVFLPMLANGGTMVFHDTAVERFDHHRTYQPPYPVRLAVESLLTHLDYSEIPYSATQTEESFGLMTVTVG